MFLVYFIVGLVPAALIVLAGIFVRNHQVGEKLARRWLFFLFFMAALLFAIEVRTFQWDDGSVGLPLFPSLVGILVAFLLHLGTTRELRSGKTVWFTIPAMLAIMAGMVYWFLKVEAFTPIIIVFAALAWQAWEWQGKLRWLAYPVLLILLLMVGHQVIYPYLLLENEPEWFIRSKELLEMTLPMVAVVIIARLIYTNTGDAHPSKWPAVVIRLILAVLLLLYIGYQIVQEGVWAEALDHLTFISFGVFLATIASGMLLAWAGKGWRRWVGLGFAVLVMALASFAYLQGEKKTPTDLTESRADRIEQAIQRYYDLRGNYPARLSNLIPFYLWRIPQPMIFKNHTWCYEGGENHYRLGYVYQPHFGSYPIERSIRIHAAVGVSPRSSWPCVMELEHLQSKAPGY